MMYIKYVIFTDNTGISLITFKARPIFAVKPWNVLLSRQLTLTGNVEGSSDLSTPLDLSSDCLDPEATLGIAQHEASI
jgi:hypothetical protein